MAPPPPGPALPSRGVRAYAGAAGLALLGVLGYWTWTHTALLLENPAPVEMSCAAWLADPPPARWVRLHGCTVETRHAHFQRRYGGYREAYVPLRADGDLSDAPARLALLTADPSYLGIAGDDRTTPAGDLWRLSFDMPPLHGMRVEGVLDWEVRPDDDLVRSGVVAPGVRWLRHDDAPSPLYAGLFGAAFVGFGILWARFVARRPGGGGEASA